MRFSLGSTSNDSANSDATVGEFCIIRIKANGANSSLQVNDQTPITGNFGTAALNAFAIADVYSGGSVRDANICYRNMIFRKGIDAAGKEAAIYNCLLKKK